MQKVIIWGLNEVTRYFIQRCWVELEKDFEVVAFTQTEDEFSDGGGVANNGFIRVENLVSKFVYPSHLREIDYDICFVAAFDFGQMLNKIKSRGFIPDNKQIIPAFQFANIAYRIRFLKFCDQNEAFKNENLRVYEFVKNHSLVMYPYEWFHNVKDIPVEIHDDRGCGMKYAIYNGKKMYYPINSSAEQIAGSINFFIKEQMLQSPHCYRPNAFHNIFKGDIVVDGGAAEANFSLDIIDMAKKIYIYEGEARWIAALEKTFQDYQDRVVIIDKFLDSSVHRGYETIDNTVTEKEINFIKMDIEGYELKALYGAKEHIRNSSNLRLSICAYHNHEDAEMLSWYLQSLNCKCHVGEGKLFRTDDSIWQSRVPDLRHGMIYAVKEKAD